MTIRPVIKGFVTSPTAFRRHAEAFPKGLPSPDLHRFPPESAARLLQFSSDPFLVSFFRPRRTKKLPSSRISGKSNLSLHIQEKRASAATGAEHTPQALSAFRFSGNSPSAEHLTRMFLFCILSISFYIIVQITENTRQKKHCANHGKFCSFATRKHFYGDKSKNADFTQNL